MGENKKPKDAYANVECPKGILKSQNDKQYIFIQANLPQ